MAKKKKICQECEPYKNWLGLSGVRVSEPWECDSCPHNGKPKKSKKSASKTLEESEKKDFKGKVSVQDELF